MNRLLVIMVVLAVALGLVLFFTMERSDRTPSAGAPEAAGPSASNAPAPVSAPAPVAGAVQASKQGDVAAATTAVVTGETAVAPLPRPTVATEHPALQHFVDRASSARFGSDFTTQVPTVEDSADIAWVVYVLRDHTDLDAVRNEAANLLARSQVPGLEDHLLAVLDSPHEKARFQSYAVQHLGNVWEEFRANRTTETTARERAVAAGVAQALQSPHVQVRSEALLILARQRDPRAAQVIRAQLTATTTDYPQEILINCAQDAGLSDLIPDIRPLAYAENPVVRIAAINALAQWKDDASRPAFEEASRSTVPRLQRAGKLALSLLEQAN